ncbi:NAD synthetase [Crocosphaera watsonii WH 8501]|nr:MULTISPECIES: hypothetical protein [Crocosphaera]MCH2246681.1 NAD synthetase [Crocosphaera sp.]NQZ65106.1 NAD synthetase [Crocosphaera sp.]
MEPNTTLDFILGGIALIILIVGMLMLFSGTSEINKK